MAAAAVALADDRNNNNNNNHVVRINRRERHFRDRLNPLENEHFSEDDIKERYRFSRAGIYQIMELIIGSIAHPTARSFALPPLLQLLTCLQFLACGNFYYNIGDVVRVSKATTCRCVLAVCTALVGLSKRYIKFPPNDMLRNVKAAFYRKAQFPKVIGCVDGVLFPILKPGLNTLEFISRKGFAAINGQVIYLPYV